MEPELATLVTARRMGLTRDELNELTMGDFLVYVDMWTYDPDDEDIVRPATQADIDAFF